MKRGFFHLLFNRWLVKVLSLAAAVILSLFYQINNLEERHFSIPLELLTHQGFSATGDYPRNVRVSVKGEEDLVYSVLDNDVSASADFRSCNGEGNFTSPVKISIRSRYGQGEDTMEVKVEPSKISIFQEEKIIRSVEVKPNLRGLPPNGYELVQFFLSPSSVTVQGPRSQLGDVENVMTEEIDLSGRYDDFTVSSRLMSPGKNVSFPGGITVEFRAVVDEAIVVQAFGGLDIVTVDLDPQLLISENLPEVSITLQGSQLVLEQLHPRDLHFFIDCSKIIMPGSYTLPIQMDRLENIAVLQYHPREIPVSFASSRGSP